MSANPVHSFNSIPLRGTVPDEDDDPISGVDESEELESQRQEQIFKVYEAFGQFLQTGNCEPFFKVAGKFRQTLAYRVTFLRELKEQLSAAKNPDDLTLCRKIAFFEGMFNPNSLFARIIQAVDYLRTRDTNSAYCLLNRGSRDLNREMGYAIAEIAFQQKNRMVVHYLANLLELFSNSTTSKKRKRE